MARKLKNIELNRVSVDEFKAQKKFPIVLLLDNVRSMMNVGAAFRTADALNVDKLYLAGITATPPHREITKTAIGAELAVNWEHVSDPDKVVRKLKEEGYTVVGLEQTDSSISMQDWAPIQGGKWLVIVGNEVDGVDQNLVDLCDILVEIPQFGTKHSLNVSVSTGMVLWHLVSKLL